MVWSALFIVQINVELMKCPAMEEKTIMVVLMKTFVFQVKEVNNNIDLVTNINTDFEYPIDIFLSYKHSLDSSSNYSINYV